MENTNVIDVKHMKRLSRYLCAKDAPTIIMHEASGYPTHVTLDIDSSTATLLIKARRHVFFSRTTSIPLSRIHSLTCGLYSPNFMRTAKYADADDLYGEYDDTLFCLNDEEGNSILDLEIKPEEDCIHVIQELLSLLKIKENLDPVKPLSPTGFIYRTFCFMHHKWMDRFILTCIMLSVLIMVLSSPVGMDPGLQSVFDVFEWAFSIVFTIEAVLRIIALEGVVPYLMNPWNVLDFVIVVTGWVTALPFMTTFKFTAFRAFRALRALRTMKYLQGLRDIVDTFVDTLRMMSQALLVYFYFVVLFATFGIQVFAGVFSNRCAIPYPAAPVPPGFSGVNGNFAVSPMQYCIPSSTSNGSGTVCSMGHTCEFMGNPNKGFHSFDSFGSAFLTTLQLSSRAGGMSKLLEAVATTVSPLTALYFIAVLVFINYMVLSLFIAIVRISFGQVQKHAKKMAAKAAAMALKEKEAAARAAAAEGGALVLDVAEDAASEGSSQSFRAPAADNILSKLIAFPAFDNIVSFAIMLNCVFLSMEFHNQPQWYASMLATAELVFTFVFLGELIIKMIGLGGARVYLQYDKNAAWNVFDFIIVLTTCVDLVLSVTDSGEFINLSFLRVFRLLRVVRVLRRNPDIFRIINAILGSLVPLFNLLSFMLVIMTLFAILGMQLFGGNWGSPPPRTNFDNFPFAMLSLFQAFSGGDKWGQMFTGIEGESGSLSFFFFFFFEVFSGYITLNFLVVILMGNFAPTKEEVNRRRHLRNTATEVRVRGRLTSQMVLYKEPALISRGSGSSVSTPATPSAFKKSGSLDGVTAGKGSGGKTAVVQAQPLAAAGAVKEEMEVTAFDGEDDVEKVAAGVATESSQQAQAGDGEAPTDASHAAAAGDKGDAAAEEEEQQQQLLQTEAQRGLLRRLLVPAVLSERRAEMSLFLLVESHPLRTWCTRLVEKNIFEAFIIVCIIISSAFLALESPLGVSTTVANLIKIADYTFLVVFLAEFLLKVVAYGFCLSSRSYMSDSWNRLDILVLGVTLFSMLGGGSGVGRTLRVGRILRPLRMINRNEGMKVIVDALLRSLPAVFYAVVLLAFLFFLFAVLGLGLFSGRFYSCNDPSAALTAGVAGCVGVFTSPKTGVVVPRLWSNPPYSFDNIFTSLRTLLEVVSLKAWLPVMRSGMDVTAIGQQPVANANPTNAVYFLVFVFSGAFFMLKLFVGIIVGTFRQFSGTALLTDRQLLWLDMKRTIQQVRLLPRKPSNPVRSAAHSLTESNHFTHAFSVLIVLHIVVLMLKSVNDPPEYEQLFLSVHYVFAGLYGMELLLLLLAHGPIGFWKEAPFWHSIDTGVFVCMLLLPNSKEIAILRALRVGRIVDLSERFANVKKLMHVLGLSLVPMLNVTTLYCMILFVYAVLGVQLFATVKMGSMQGSALADFSSFTNALLTLFAILGGENWKGIMYDMEVTVPFCTAADPKAPVGSLASIGDCGSPLLAPMYFFSFFIVTFAVFVNLYLATILDTYTAAFADRKQEHWYLSDSEYDHYKKVWAHFDKTSSGFVQPNKLRYLMMELGYPLGMRVDEETATMEEMGKDQIKFQRIRQELMFIQPKKGRSLKPKLTKGSSSVTPATTSTMSGLDKTLQHPIPFLSLLKLLVVHRVPPDGLDMSELVTRRFREQAAEEYASAVMLQQFARRQLKMKQLEAGLRDSPVDFELSGGSSSIVAHMLSTGGGSPTTPAVAFAPRDDNSNACKGTQGGEGGASSTGSVGGGRNAEQSPSLSPMVPIGYISAAAESPTRLPSLNPGAVPVDNITPSKRVLPYVVDKAN